MSVLTPMQQKTKESLLKGEFKTLTQSNITRLLKRELDNAETAKTIIPAVKKYEKYKFPNKSDKEIDDYVAKKLGKSEREIWRSGGGDPSGKADGSAVNEKFDPNVIIPPSKQAPTKPAKSLGSASELDELLDNLLGKYSKGKDGGGKTMPQNEVQKPTTAVVPSKPSTGFSPSDIFKTGSDVYKKNEALANKLLAGSNNGSWLTTLMSLEAPEIQILQSIVKQTPLGFTSSDEAVFEKLLQNPNDTSVGEAEGMAVLAKLLVNPDKVGKLVKSRFSQKGTELSDRFVNWTDKIRGIDPEKPKEQLDLEKTFQERVDKTQAQRDKEVAIAKLRGREAPTDTGKTLSQDEIRKLLSPPPIPGYKAPTAADDAGSFLKGIIFPDYSTGTSKEKYLKRLKENSPATYNQYQEAMRDYENKKNKLLMSPSSAIDLKQNRELLELAHKTTENMMRRAAKISDISDNTIEQMYDISATLESLADGKGSISYNDLAKTMQMLIDVMPVEVLTDSDVSRDIEYLDQYASDNLASQFTGDSDLGQGWKLKQKADAKTSGSTSSTDQPVPEVDPTKSKTKEGVDVKDPEVPEDDPEPEEEKPQPVSSKTRMIDQSPSDIDSLPKYRTRGEWGDTDDLFGRDKEEVKMGNIISELMSVEAPGFQGRPDSILYKANLKQDSMRYGKTFNMPPPMPSPKTDPPKSWVQKATPIMVPWFVPAQREFYDYSRDEYLFGQYQALSSAYPHTVFPVDYRSTHANEFPYVVDEVSGGLEQKLSKKYNHIQNQRWTRA